MFDKISLAVRRTLLVIKALKKVYKYGGYTTFNIANIQYGEILKEKKVLITGGGSGIGLSIAKKCLEEGAIVVITGRNKKKLQETFEEVNHPNLKQFVWDVSDLDLLDEGVEIAKRLLKGDVDILVNNAAVMDGTSFPYVTEEIWDSIYATNSKGLFFITQKVCGQWMKESSGQLKKVINISSQGGFVGATYPYRMTKWDVAGFTQGLGKKLAPYGIIVNGIAPGIIATNMQVDCLKQKDNVHYAKNPIARFGLPEEIAELAVFLMSDGTNFIVGHTIICDGGYSLK